MQLGGGSSDNASKTNTPSFPRRLRPRRRVTGTFRQCRRRNTARSLETRQTLVSNHPGRNPTSEQRPTAKPTTSRQLLRIPSRVFSATSWISMHAGHSMYRRSTTGWKSSSRSDPDCTCQRRLWVGQQQQSMCTKSRCPNTPLGMMFRFVPTRSLTRGMVRPFEFHGEYHSY